MIVGSGRFRYRVKSRMGEIAFGLVAVGSDQSLVVLISQNPRPAEVASLKRRAIPPFR